MKTLLALFPLALLGCTDPVPEVDPDPDPDPDPVSNDCPTNLTVTTAMRLDIPTSWDPEDPAVIPGIPGYAAGEGTTKLWLLQELTFDDTTTVRVKIRPCGTLLPPVEKIVGYEGSIVMDTPPAVFDRFAATDTTITLSDLGPDATFDVPPQRLVIGVDMPDPDEPWPADWTTAALRDRLTDPDDDGLPGLSVFPQTGPGLVPPITVLSATNNAQAPTTAAQVGVALRAEIAVAGARQGCAKATGTAEILRYDAQTVGCVQADGDTCTPGQARFVDEHTPLFQFSPGTLEMTLIGQASCEAVRTALP